jgi:sec-independent protein translocase protein TatA
MAGLTPAHLLIILVIALIVIGPGKLPEVGAAIGKSFREFQKASSGIAEAVTGPATTAGQPVQQTQAQVPGAVPGGQMPGVPGFQQVPVLVPVQQVAQPPSQSYYAAQPGYALPPSYPVQPVYAPPVFPPPAIVPAPT